MTDAEFLTEVVERARSADTGYFAYAHIAACVLDKQLHEQLRQLVNGPVWDGDVLSKSYRSELIELGLGVRVCKDGEQGFTGATYFGYSVNKVIEEIRTGKIGA